jgi:hypothetical protein
MNYSEICASPFTVWRDEKNSNLYVVLCIAYDMDGEHTTIGPSSNRVCVFSCCTTGLIKSMNLHKFLDGRYVPIGFRIEEKTTPKEDKGISLRNGLPLCSERIIFDTELEGRTLAVGCVLPKGHPGMHKVGN